MFFFSICISMRRNTARKRDVIQIKNISLRIICITNASLTIQSLVSYSYFVLRSRPNQPNTLYNKYTLVNIVKHTFSECFGFPIRIKLKCELIDAGRRKTSIWFDDTIFNVYKYIIVFLNNIHFLKRYHLTHCLNIFM